MHTIRLIYVSDARDDLSYRDFMKIMDKAAKVNRDRQITGMLCYGGGQFLQALEGERVAVSALYVLIATDPRHANCQLLSVEEIEAREFPEWSMKIVDWSDAVSAAQAALLEQHAGSPVFDPRTMSAAQAGAFLRDVAAMERLLTE